MRIEGIHAGAVSAPGGTKTEDAISKSLQKQIENAQKQMQELAKNEQMSPEDKMKKRQELQKQITDLNGQLRQHEIELRRKQAEEAREKREREAQENGADRAQKEREQEIGFSEDGMNAMLKADSAMRQAHATDGVVTRMKGEKNVLAGEIKQDRSRGVDTTKKEEKLSDMESRIDSTIGAQIKTFAKAGKELNETAEKEYDEQVREKEEEADDLSGAEKTDLKNETSGDDGTPAQELVQKMEKEGRPGQVIDERL